MKSIDTETTGLWWQHNTVAFAIGIMDQGRYQSEFVSIDPLTRRTTGGFSDVLTNRIRGLILSQDTDLVAFQNANFDVKALCKSGFFSWEEPSRPKFWENILELGHLMHLHDSTDAKSHSSLKVLAPKYLDVNYRSEEELDRIVNRCRIFARNRLPQWRIANKATVKQAHTAFNKMDMWLPDALLNHYEDQDFLKRYMEEDYELLGTVVNDYLKDDCQYTHDLAEAFLNDLATTYPNELDRLLSMNRDLFPVIWDMETLGITIHKDRLSSAIETCNEWVAKCEKECQDLSELESFTPANLRRFLFEENDTKPIIFTEKNEEPSTSQPALLALKQQPDLPPRVNAFLTNHLAKIKYETKLKYLSGYQRVIQRSSRVPYDLKTNNATWLLFPSLKSTGTGTTRFSSSNPNSQNIEKEGDPFGDKYPDVMRLLKQSPSLRSIFGPEKGRWWLPIDYSQLQLRIFAAATKDPALIQSFRDGYDFHDFMAHVIFDLPKGQPPTTIQRRIAKNVNFGFIFGASEHKIDKTAQRPGLYSYLMDCFPNAKEFLLETKARIKDEGLVYTLGGYPLHIPLRESPWGGMSYAAHMGVNYIVQGTEGEIVKRAMCQTHWMLRNYYPDSRLIMQVHDEIIFDTPADIDKQIAVDLSDKMVEAGAYYGVETPVDVELCRNNLAEKESFKCHMIH